MGTGWVQNTYPWSAYPEIPIKPFKYNDLCFVFVPKQQRKENPTRKMLSRSLP